MSTEYQRLHAENGLNVNASPWTGPSAHLGANTYAPSTSALPLATTILRPNGTPVGNPSVTSSPPTVQYSSASLDYLNQDRIVCKFFLQGGCGRGENCSYLHELPQDSTLSAVADCNVTGIVFNVNAKNTAAIQRQGSAEPNSTSGSSMGHSATTPGHLTHQHLHHPSNNNTLLHHHISNENELAFGYDTYGAYGQVSIPSNGWSGLETSNTSGPVIEYHANHLAHDLAQGTNTGAGALYNQGSFPQNSLDAVYYHTDSGNMYTNATSTTHAAGPTSNTSNSVSTSGAANFHASPGSASNTTTSTLLIPSSNMTTAAAWNLGTHSAVNTATTLQVVGSNVLGAGTDATATSTAGYLGTSNGATQNILTSGPNEHGLPTSHNRHIFDPNCTTTTTTTTTTHHHLHHHHHPSHPHAHAHPHGSAPHIMSSTHHHTLGLPSSNAQQGTSIVPASSKGLLSGNNSTTSASQTITSQPSASGTGARNVQISSRNPGTQELDAATQLRLASAALQQGASPSGYLNAAISQRSTNSAQNSMGTAPHTSHSSQSVPLSGHTSTTGNYNSGMGDTTSTVSKEMKGLNKLSNRGGNNSNSVTINQHFGSDALGSGSASIASHRAQSGGVLHNKGIHSEHREGAGSNSISPSQRRILHISKTSRMAERIIPASTEALIDPMVNEIVGTMSGPTKKPLSNKFLPVTIQSYLKSSCNFLAESGSENMSASNKCGVQTNSGGGGGKNKSGKTHHGRNNRSHH